MTKYINDHGYSDVGVLVAFSGSLDIDGDEVTEAKINGIPESPGRVRQRRVPDPRRRREVPDRLRPAEALRDVRGQAAVGLAAVQTLSRLNGSTRTRTARSSSTSATTPRTSAPRFNRTTATTVAPPTDPNLMYDTRHALDEYGVLWPDEIETVVALLLDRRQLTTDGYAALARRSTCSRSRR